MSWLRVLAVPCVVVLFSSFASAGGAKEVVVRGLFVRTVSEEARAGQIDSFSLSMRRHGVTGVIDGCDDIWVVPVGVVNGNRSYGAVCNFKTADGSYSSFVCNDVMVGHFYMSKQYSLESRWIVESIFDHCYGG